MLSSRESVSQRFQCCAVNAFGLGSIFANKRLRVKRYSDMHGTYNTYKARRPDP